MSDAPGLGETTLLAAQRVRALARAITRVESGASDAPAILQAARAALAQAAQPPTVIGLTGSPGSGKSTLVSALIGQLRASGKTVGVLAVDPSSPFSGGAILGDRIRMLGHHADAGVYVRSRASRGALGGRGGGGGGGGGGGSCWKRWVSASRNSTSPPSPTIPSWC